MNGNDQMAQSFYLAQLQACKGSCKCNVCQILRKASDQMSAQLLKGDGKDTPSLEDSMNDLIKAGYKIEAPGAREGDR